MMQSVFGLLLLMLGLLAAALDRLYFVVPAHELKRLAARHDELAGTLYRVVAYGAALHLLLWGVASLSLAGSYVMLAAGLPGAALFAGLFVVLVAQVAILPRLRLTMRGAGFAAFFAAPLSAVLHYTGGWLERVAAFLRQHREAVDHTGLFEKEDLVGLVERQSAQAGNRIPAAELELVRHALQFDERQAADVLQSRHDLRLVSAADTVGPVLLGELHASGQTSFLVYEDKPENIIGTLAMRDAVKAKQGGRVMELTRHDLCYVHEDFTLSQVMSAFISTKQHVAVVVNGFEEAIGVITLDRLLQQLLGEAQADPVDSYDDRSAVAAYKAAPRQAAETTAASSENAGPAKADPSATEAPEAASSPDPSVNRPEVVE